MSKTPETTDEIVVSSSSGEDSESESENESENLSSDDGSDSSSSDSSEDGIRMNEEEWLICEHSITSFKVALSSIVNILERDI